MLRKIGSSLFYGCRHIRPFQCRAMCVGGFKSSYSLDKLHPNTSNPDLTITAHSAQKQIEASSKEDFCGHIPVDKLKIKYSHSSGPGGQHVNKVNTKADVRFHVATAEWLPQHIREKILEKKQSKINKAGELVITSERTRSQMTNFADCLHKIRDIVDEVTRVPKEPTAKDKAVATMRIENANRERLKQKKFRSSIKRDRKAYFE